MLRQVFSAVLEEAGNNVESVSINFLRIQARAVPTLICSFTNRFASLRNAEILILPQPPRKTKINGCTLHRF